MGYSSNSNYVINEESIRDKIQIDKFNSFTKMDLAIVEQEVGNSLNLSDY
jgi:hypothetical protein